MLACGCSDRGQESRSGRSDPACVADSLGEIRVSISVPECEAGDPACRDACLQGDAGSCLGRAYAIERENAAIDEATALFRRACALGSANGCTNYAATIWARDHTDEELSCALRLFEKSCAANEPYGCGMVGRVLLDRASSPQELSDAERKIEASCEDPGGFSCRVLAKQLETVEPSVRDSDRIAALLERACEGGDPDACGRPATASETFH